jgi:hypothetical protein
MLEVLVVVLVISTGFAQIQAILLVAATSALLLASLLATLRIGLLRLDSPLGIHRDGLRVGTRAPSWRLPDSVGTMHESPSRGRWQLLVFADHSLREFPDAASALGEIVSKDEADVVLLTRIDATVVSETARLLGLPVPMIVVDGNFYWKYNVRVMPFLLVLDLRGIVRASGLANSEAAVQRLWMLARGRYEFERRSEAAAA